MIIAAFQCRPIFDDIDGAVNYIARQRAICNSNEVSLAVFPECFLQGYSMSTEVLKRRAIKVDSSDVHFQDILRRTDSIHGVVVFGVMESNEARLFNTAVVVERGAFLGKYQKVHPNEKEVSAGTEYPIFFSSGYGFGINICNDANYPDEARRLKRNGAQIICFPLNNMLPQAIAEKWRERTFDNLRFRAIENNCWVVSSDVVGEVEGLVSYGCTAIISPKGEIAARVPEGKEGVAIANIEARDLKGD